MTLSCWQICCFTWKLISAHLVMIGYDNSSSESWCSSVGSSHDQRPLSPWRQSSSECPSVRLACICLLLRLRAVEYLVDVRFKCLTTNSFSRVGDCWQHCIPCSRQYLMVGCTSLCIPKEAFPSQDCCLWKMSQQRELMTSMTLHLIYILFYHTLLFVNVNIVTWAGHFYFLYMM